MSLMPFHLAIPVHDLPAARRFYGEVFGLSEGRSAEHWVDFDFFGHQLVIHQHPQTDSQRHAVATRWTATTCRCRTSAWSSPGTTGTPWPNA
ncbi:ring-cleaving dioxygenase [Pseudomonas aeruginosa]|nr:ring-cleaving dioxygenase [Pseudomonas aeruginosa]